jgi:phosphoribosylformylglycinamidine synthase
MKIDLSKVPLREPGMSAYEILLSESQERMLVVTKKGFEDKVIETFDKWDLHCEIIGEVTKDGKLDIEYDGEKKADVPAFDLVLGGGAPVYSREVKKPQYLNKKHKFDKNTLIEPESNCDAFLEVFASPNIVSKNWVYEQYDSMVRTNTIVGPGSDAAVVYVKDTNKALAISTDCNGRYVYLNPREGAKIAVAEAARNVVCSGGKPLAITNCLNFGNPYKPQMYYNFKEAVEGMGEACKYFNTPVTGGNVSFYNESPDTAVYPTPVIGMLGLIENLDNIMTPHFKAAGNIIYLLGTDKEELGGSEYLKTVHGLVEGNSPVIDLKFEKKLQRIVLELIENKFIRSAHDVSEGGIMCALAECCILDRENPVGAVVNIPVNSRSDFAFFSESQSRVIVSIDSRDVDRFEAFLKPEKIPYTYLGKTGGSYFDVNDQFDFKLDTLIDIYYNTIAKKMNV